MNTPITYTRRLQDLADEDEERAALICVGAKGEERTWTRAELRAAALHSAHAMRRCGVAGGDVVVLALPNGADLVVLSYAAWWLGACVLPLSPKLPAPERARVLQAVAGAGRRAYVVDRGGTVGAALRADGLLGSANGSGPLPDVVPRPGRAIASGGSTGLPKIIVDPRPHVAVPGAPNLTHRLLGRPPRHTALVFGPLYHTLSFGTVFSALFDGGKVVLLERFDEHAVLDAIERHRVEVLAAVPAHLARLARLPEIAERDLSSVVSLYHSGAPCPRWLKRRWMDLLGPERVYEGFGSTEAVGMLVIRGDEWLRHEGSVGRCEVTEVVIRDEEGRDLPEGSVGEIFLRWREGAGYSASAADQTFEYWGAPPARATDDGFVSVGDLGWLDGDHLYVADRRTDMIITGGVNVYPAEIEAVLSSHPFVADIAVVGLPDDEWGRRVHAIVQPAPGAPDPDVLRAQLDALCRSELSSVKAPKSYELVEELPRNDIGKVSRGRLQSERVGTGRLT